MGKPLVEVAGRKFGDRCRRRLARSRLVVERPGFGGEITRVVALGTRRAVMMVGRFTATTTDWFPRSARARIPNAKRVPRMSEDACGRSEPSGARECPPLY
jgi:hypothetical protein